MRLRERIRKRVQRTIGRFTGDYSTEAPETTIPYERDLGEDPEREVVRARLPRLESGRKE